MRLSIDHRTVYRFSEPQSRLVQMLRLTPENTHDQTVAGWRIDVDRDARLREGRDGFGNAVTMLYVEGPLDGIAITVSGEVLTSTSSGVLRGAAETDAGGAFVGAMIGARGCVSYDVASDAYSVTVTWQGLGPTSAPPDEIRCAVGLYGDDAQRRAVTLSMRIADL